MYTKKEYLKHSLLFVVTLIATTFAGGEWLFGRSILGSEDTFLTWPYFIRSLHFSIPFIGILLIHELGHLLTAIKLGVRSSLPYFIPGWFGILPSIGTFGAIISMKSRVNSRRKYFDIGVAGPLAGFILAFGVLFYGFTHLPEADYIYEIHPEYLDPNFDRNESVEDGFSPKMGYNLLFYSMEKLLADSDRMPDMSELYHFPYLFAGYLALFFTALNLMPIGQLDGGHIIFGLFPKHHQKVSLIAYTAFIFYAGLGVINPYHEFNSLIISIPLYVGFLYICYKKSGLETQTIWTLVLLIAASQYVLGYFLPTIQGYSGWLFFAFLLGRVMGLAHPEVRGNREMNFKRKVLGWIAIVIFILCFTPQPFIFEG